MAVGKSSLNRVAKGGVISAVAPEVVASVAPVIKEVKEKTVASKTAKPKSAVSLGKIYAVGDKLPEYLL